MIWVILAVFSVAFGCITPILLKGEQFKLVRGAIRVASILVALALIVATSFVIIDADKVGHMKRVFGGKSMKPGQIIALTGEMGPQAEILPPGFQFRLLLNVLYDVEDVAVVDVPVGRQNRKI